MINYRVSTFIIITVITLLCSVFLAVASLADNSQNEAAIMNESYWYGDDDIRTIVSKRLTYEIGEDKFYIAPALSDFYGSLEVINDVVKAALDEAKLGKFALMPINLNGNHWTAMAICLESDGGVIVLYNDSLGRSISFSGVGSKYLDVIKELEPTCKILDLQVRQQKDYSSCGVYAAENLITFAKLKSDCLIAKQIRIILDVMGDAKTLRKRHLRDLMS